MPALPQVNLQQIEPITHQAEVFVQCETSLVMSYAPLYHINAESTQLTIPLLRDTVDYKGSCNYSVNRDGEAMCKTVQLASCEKQLTPELDFVFNLGMLTDNDSKSVNSEIPAKSCAFSVVESNLCAQPEDAFADRLVDSTIPWDPGEIYDYNKTKVEFNGIPPHGIGVQDVKDMNGIATYARVLVNGYETLLEVDSGCTNTVISEDFARFMGLITDSDKPDPNIVNLGAGGTKIPSYGYKPGEIEINGIKLQGKMLISRVRENGFLGMDLLAAAGAIINFDEMYIEIYEQKVPLLTREGKRIVNSLHTKKSVYLPKHSQNVVDIALRDCNSKVGLVEPRGSVLSHYGVFGGRNIGTASNLKIKLINPLPHDIVIPAGTSIAYYVPQEAIQMPTIRNEGECRTHGIQTTEIDEHTPIPEHVQCLYDQLPDDISDDIRNQVRRLLILYSDVFSKDENDVGFCDWVKHEIKLIPGTKPIRQPPYRTGYHENIEIEKHVTKLLNSGMIERVVSPWSSPVLLVAKKDGKTRFVQDYRKLNACTEQESYPLPRQDDALEALSGSKYFTTADLTSGYYQIALSEEATKVSCFVTKSGTYGFKRLPMGLSTSSHCFERLMETVLRGLQYEELLVYMDDVIVFSSDEQQHVDRLGRMLSRLHEAGLKIKPSKTFMFQTRVKYLGHIVDEQGIHTDPDKIEAIVKIDSPTNVKSLRSFLGLTGYYRKFIPNYGIITRPLNKLLKKKAKYIWDADCQKAFDTLKQSLCDNTILAYPDYMKPFILDTDASYVGCGAVLSQLDKNNDERPIAYYSFALNDAQKNYGVTKLEMLGLVSAVRHFKTYLYGAKFLCRTDHHSLIWLNSMKQPQGILARWLETLSNYNFTVEHRAGQLHTNADALSRLPYEDQLQQIALPAEVCNSDHIATFQLTPTNDAAVADDSSNNEVNSLSIDQQELEELQKSDPDIKRIIEWTENDVYPPQKEFKKFTKCIRFYLGKRESLMMKDNLLVETSGSVNRLVIPHSLQQKVIDSFHQADHAGIERTFKRINTYYLWHSMHSTIRDYITLCHSCQVNKNARNKTNPRSLATGAIMDQVSLDIVGSFRPTKQDNTVILVAVEHFSRWAEAYPLTHASAENIATALYNGMFAKFGFSRIIHMDRAAYFMSDLMAELATLAGAKNTFSCRYHPQGNSMVERVNGTIVNSLRSAVDSNPDVEWDELLEPVLVAYRATPHPATGFTPNRLMLGREVRLAQVLCPMSDELATTEYIKRLDHTLYIAYNQQRNILAEENHFDGAIHTPFNQGDLVLIQKKKSELNKPGKLESRYYGPFRVVKRLDFDSYVIEENGKSVLEHHSRLKRYH